LGLLEASKVPKNCLTNQGDNKVDDMGTRYRGSYQPGYSLPQQLYCSDEQFRTDMKFLSATQWLLVDHASRIRNAGDFFVFRFASEEIIIVRGHDTRIRGFRNVCRHRGSRVCLDEAGSAGGFVCPYHAWTYTLTGALKRPPHMPSDFDATENGLLSVHLETFCDIIFINLAEGEPPGFESFAAPMRAYLEPHGLTRSKVAARLSVPTAANWKLVTDNFYECYHCRSAHKTYCSVHDHMKLLALGAGPGSADADIAERYRPILENWERLTRAKGHMTGMFSDGPDSRYLQAAARLPISPTALTESADGLPVAPLMGDFAEYDGGQTGCIFNPLSTVLANNDYCVLVRITPRAPLTTDFEMVWLVDSSAEEGIHYDLARLTEVWTITLEEDKTITENNQAGVLSGAYRPGRLSVQEQRIADFTEWYMRGVQPYLCLSDAAPYDAVHC